MTEAQKERVSKLKVRGQVIRASFETKAKVSNSKLKQELAQLRKENADLKKKVAAKDDKAGNHAAVWQDAKLMYEMGENYKATIEARHRRCGREDFEDFMLDDTKNRKYGPFKLYWDKARERCR